MQFVNFSEAFALLPQHGSQSVTDHVIPHWPAHLSITQRVDSEFCQTVLTEMEIIFLLDM